MAKITEQATVGGVIIQKGMNAAKIMDDFFCIQGCCPGTSLCLDAAAKLMRKSGEELGLLVEDLNKLPDARP